MLGHVALRAFHTLLLSPSASRKWSVVTVVLFLNCSHALNSINVHETKLWDRGGSPTSSRFDSHVDLMSIRLQDRFDPTRSYLGPHFGCNSLTSFRSVVFMKSISFLFFCDFAPLSLQNPADVSSVCFWYSRHFDFDLMSASR